MAHHETKSDNAAAPDGLTAIDGLQERLGRPSRTTIWRRVRAGELPKPVKWGGKNYWSDREIDDVIAARLAARNRR